MNYFNEESNNETTKRKKIIIREMVGNSNSRIGFINHFHHFLKHAWVNGRESIILLSRRTRLIISYVNTFYKFRFAPRLITTVPLN